MAKDKRKGRHAKRKGPGGPSRPHSIGGSRRITTPGGDAPTVSLVDSLLDGFEPLAPDAHAAAVVMLEDGADELLEMFLEQPGPHLRPMLTSVAHELARRRTPTADALLAVLAALAPGHGRDEFGPAWRQRAAEPDTLWAARHNGADTVVEALEVGNVCGDGVNLTLAVHNPAGDYTVAVYIDHNLGGMAKDLLVGPPMDAMRQVFGAPDDGFVTRTVPTDEAWWRFVEAMGLTDHTLDAPVSEDFYDYLYIVSRRFQLLADDAGPEPDAPPWGHREVSNAERIAHVAAFMASPEGQALPAGQMDEAVGMVRLFIDHAVDHTVGPARRVSPTLVELFCADWFPRKVVADEEMLAVAPAALEAWLRFAARTTELDDRWLDEALDGLEQWGPAMRRSIDDPGSWGLAKGLLGPALSRGLSGGIDVIDDDGDVTTTSTATWQAPEGNWEPLEEAVEGGRVHVEADPSGVSAWQYAKTKIIAQQVTMRATHLLGPSFAQPAMDLAIALGSAEPCPYDHSQMRSWPGAIIWLLAEDNDAFERSTPGRRRDDLADQLPLTRATYQTKATKIRDTLGLSKGDYAVPHQRARR